MTRIAAFAVLASIGVVPVVADAPQQTGSTTIQATVTRDGQVLIPSPGQLHIEVDDRSIPVLRVVRHDGPATILLLVDLTWSTTRGGHPGVLRPTASRLRQETGAFGPNAQFPGLLYGMEKAFLPWLHRDDRLLVGTFAGRHMTFSPTSASTPADRLALYKASITPAAAPLDGWFGAAPIWDAVASAAGRLAKLPPPRAIVLVTDGQASGNRIGLPEAIQIAAGHGVPVHVVCTKSWWDTATYPGAEALISTLAEQSGGLFRTDRPFDRMPWDKPQRIFGDLVDAIHWSVTVDMELGDLPAGSWPLNVSTTVPDAVVSAPKWIVRSPGSG
jgi:hypothetical protein